MQSPIGVFAHDRPNHLQFCLEALKHCPEFSDCPVTIFCDGARTEEAERRVKDTRDVAKRWAQKENITVVEREENLCFGNLVQGVSQLCDEYGCAIVIEDDLAVAPDFLTYMRRSLKRYQHDERVYSINGFMFFDAQPKEPTTFFLPTAFATGWATWKRAWDHFEWRPKGWQDVLRDRKARNRWDFNGKWRMSDWFEKAMTGSLACWDPQWAYTIFSRGGVSLFPSRSLIWNTGFSCGMMNPDGAQSLEGRDPMSCGDLTYKDFKVPRFEAGWSYPEVVEVNQVAYERMVELFRAQRRSQRLANRGPWYKRLPASLGLKLFGPAEVEA